MTTSPFRRLSLDLIVTSSGDETLEAVARDRPALAVIDAELPVVSGYEVARKIKNSHPQCKVVLVMGKRINAEQMRRVAESACDEVLIAPMSPDELYDVVAIQLDQPRRGSERFSIDLAVVTDDGVRKIDGRVTNLSVDGARLVLPETLAEETQMRLTITPDEADVEPLELRARVVWAQPHEDESVIGAEFEGVDEEIGSRLSRLIQWEIVEETERIRVVI